MGDRAWQVTVEDHSTKCVWISLQFLHQYCLSVPSKNSVNSVKSVKTLGKRDKGKQRITTPWFLV